MVVFWEFAFLPSCTTLGFFWYTFFRPSYFITRPLLQHTHLLTSLSSLLSNSLSRIYTYLKSGLITAVTNGLTINGNCVTAIKDAMVAIYRRCLNNFPHHDFFTEQNEFWLKTTLHFVNIVSNFIKHRLLS